MSACIVAMSPLFSATLARNIRAAAQATTIAGLVIHEARSSPERGQSFTFHGFRFRVLRRERNRITALRIVAVPRDAEVEEKKPKRAGTAF